MKNKKQEKNLYTSPAIEWLNNKFRHVKCNHAWEYVGHGHNDSHYICRKCGSEEDY